MAIEKIVTIFMLILVFTVKVQAFEIDSFYQRERDIKDSTQVLNQEINTRIQTALAMSKSCDLKELYTNVRNQISANSAAFGIVGGMENWSEKNSAIEKIDPPSSEDSIYSNTSFESVFKVGFWLKLWGTVKENSSQSLAKAKLAVRKLLIRSSDPIEICKVPDAYKVEAKKLIEMAKHKRPPDGGGPPVGPPPTPPNGGDGPMGNPDSEFGRSEASQCLKLVLDFKGPGDNVTLQGVIKVNNTKIGTDKLGHFFDQGFDYFQKEFTLAGAKLTSNEEGLKKALDYGMSTEDGMFGLKSSGVKSYGDLAANYGGSLFWKELAAGDNPIASCQDGKFSLRRKFDFKDYVTDAWDEGINCSEYSSDKMADEVAKNLETRGQACPTEVTKCQALDKKYPQQVLTEILGPTCAKHMTSATPNESNSARGIK